MTLKEYITHLSKLSKEHGKKEVYYSIDDEGNEFRPVFYSPSIGKVGRKNVVILN